MNALSPILRSVANGKVSFWCPGCEEAHTIRVNDTEGRRPNWTYNNNPDAGLLDDDGFRALPAVCHSFVNDGQIQFLTDCTHALAGKTVAIPAWPETNGGKS